jgi:hypothetical protein
VNVESLSGGDGAGEEESMWMVNTSAGYFKGLAMERSSSFFIPLLDNVTASVNEYDYSVFVTGFNLLPCNIELSFVIRNGDGVTSPVLRYYVSFSDVDGGSALIIPSIRFQFLTKEERRRMGVCVRYSDYQGTFHESRLIPMKFWEEEEEGKEEEVWVVLGSWAIVLLVCLCVGLCLVLIVLFVDTCLLRRFSYLLDKMKQRNESIQAEIVTKNEEMVQKKWEIFEEFKASHRTFVSIRAFVVTASPDS